MTRCDWCEKEYESRLLSHNLELFKGIRLELASDSQRDVKPEQLLRLKDLEREHNRCARVAQGG